MAGKRKKSFRGKCILPAQSKGKLRMIFLTFGEALKRSNPRAAILNFLCNKYKLAKSELVRVTESLKLPPKNVSVKVKKKNSFKKERPSRGSKFAIAGVTLVKSAAMEKKRPNKKCCRK